MCKSNIPAACLQGHGENYSAFDYTNWLPVSLPSFEPLHLSQLIVATVYTDIPSDKSLRLRSHLARYIHTLGVNLGSVRGFGSFFCLPLWQGARTVTYTRSFSIIFHSLPTQSLVHCCYISFLYSLGSTQMSWYSTTLPHSAVEWEWKGR